MSAAMWEPCNHCNIGHDGTCGHGCRVDTGTESER